MIYVFCVTNRCDVKPVPIETAVRFFRHAPRKKVKSLYLEKKERKPFREPPDISTYSVFAASGVFLAISLPRAQYTRLQPRGQLLCVVAERTRICRMTLVVTSCPLLDCPAGVYFGIFGLYQRLQQQQRIRSNNHVVLVGLTCKTAPLTQ